MTKSEILLKGLKEIIQNKTPFLNAINIVSTSYSLNEKEKQQLKKELSSILKNYQKLFYEATFLFPTYSYISDEILLVIITIKFLRDKEDIKKVQSNYNSAITTYRLSLDAKDKFEEIVSRAKLPFVLEDRVKDDSILYNSIMLELPKFFLEKLLLEYSFKDILLISKKLQNNSPFYFLKNKDYLEKKIDLESKEINNIIYYQTNNFANAKDYLKKNIIYPITKVELELISKINILNVMPNILITGENTHAITNFFDSTYSHLKPKIMKVNSIENSIELEKIKLNHTTNLTSTFELLKTYLVNYSYDFVIYKGNDIKIGKASVYPNILPVLSESDFKESFENQLNNLTTISMFVNKNGLLLFYNYSLTKEENTNVVNSFLSNNSEFSLVEKESIISEETDFIGCFFILKRNAK